MEEEGQGGAVVTGVEQYWWWAAASAAQLGWGISTLRKGHAGDSRLMPLKAFSVASLFVGSSACAATASLRASGIHSIHILTQKILGLIAESLGLPSSSIKDAIGELHQNIIVSYYPPCPRPELTLGLQSHSDIGVITFIIHDDIGGLEILKNGEWIPTNPLHHAIVVILADQTEIITNEEYKSAVHRAITNSKKARLSVSSFHDPVKTKIICPAFEPPKYHQVVYGDYYSSWYTKRPEGKRNIGTLLL